MGRRASQKIPPGTFWRSQVFIDHPVHLKFNVSLGKAALVGIYGRKGLPPSHTQVIRTPHALLIARGTYLKSQPKVQKPNAQTCVLLEERPVELEENFIILYTIHPFALSPDPTFPMSRVIFLGLSKRREF